MSSLFSYNQVIAISPERGMVKTMLDFKGRSAEELRYDMCLPADFSLRVIRVSVWDIIRTCLEYKKYGYTYEVKFAIDDPIIPEAGWQTLEYEHPAPSLSNSIR